ncbi:MAG: hypothetical protein D6708_00630, partial [Candidatus Dadabacteria bacterium]
MVVITEVAGQRNVEVYSGSRLHPGLIHTFTWDGLDAYGRPFQGSATARVKVGYEYPGEYVCGRGDCPPGPQTLWSTLSAEIGTWDARGAGLGGWTLSPHHTYDSGGTLHEGDGRSRRAEFLVPTSITYVAGNGCYDCYEGDGGPANRAGFSTPWDVAVAPDGSYYIADTENDVIRKVDPSGIVTTFAGGGSPSDGLGDGLPATQARLDSPYSVALGPDGSVYIADTGNYRVRKVGLDGIITTVAGTGSRGFAGDDGSATEAQLSRVYGLEVGPDGTIYISDSGNYRVRKVDPKGNITTVAGTGVFGFSGDGGAATEAQLSQPYALALGPDGSLYVADHYNHRVRRISPLGTITTVAGNGIQGYSGDGGPAVDAEITYPQGLVVASDGVLYVSCGATRINPDWEIRVSTIRRVSPAGTITTLNTGWTFSYDDGAAGLDLAPDGSLYVAGADDSDEDYSGVHRLGPVLPGDAW